MKDNDIKILVVDDEPNIADVIKSFLESKGYVVVTADTGLKALEAFQREPISLIVLDLMLPGFKRWRSARPSAKRFRSYYHVDAKSERSLCWRDWHRCGFDYIAKPSA